MHDIWLAETVRLLHRPGITAPIIGASKMVHLKVAVKAVAVELSDDEMRALAEPREPHAMLGHS